MSQEKIWRQEGRVGDNSQSQEWLDTIKTKSFLAIALPIFPWIISILIFIYWLVLEGKRSKEERETSIVVPLIYAFIGWFLFVPWLVTEPTTLLYEDNALTNWAILPGPESSYSNADFNFTLLNSSL